MNKRIIIPLVESSCKLPMIRFDIGGEIHLALIDTGSESTLFDRHTSTNENFVLEETNYVMSLVGLGGETSKKRIISVKARLTICDDSNDYREVEVEGMLTDLTYVSEGIGARFGNELKVAAIIGSDFLTEHCAVIDYKRKELSFLAPARLVEAYKGVDCHVG